MGVRVRLGVRREVAGAKCWSTEGTLGLGHDVRPLRSSPVFSSTNGAYERERHPTVRELKSLGIIDA